MADDLKHLGSQEIEDFYSSSNGDRWRLVRDRETGHRTVRRNVSTTLIHPGSEFRLDSTTSIRVVRSCRLVTLVGDRGPLRIGSLSCVGPVGVT